MAFPKKRPRELPEEKLKVRVVYRPPKGPVEFGKPHPRIEKPEAKPEVKPQVAKAPEIKKPFKVWKILPIIIVPIIIFIIFINIGGGGPFSGEWMSPHPCTFRELLCGESRKQSIQGIFT